MLYLLRTIELTATGREIVRDRGLSGPTISVGRAAENDIHLPDLAVEPRHATIDLREGGRIDVTSAGTLAFTIDGGETREASFHSHVGAELGFGTYRILVSREGEAVLLTVRQVDEASSRVGDLEHKRGFSLAGVLPGKRITAWTLAVAIVVLFLCIPIFSHLTRNAAAEEKVVGDDAWSAGSLSLAHHGLEDQCEACHVRPFEAVRDETCLSCHDDIHDHADPMQLAASRGGGPLGDRLLWSVAHVFGKPGPGACSDCHTEHEGQTRMAAPAQKFCANCHGALASKLSDTRLGDASDFGKLHPQFTPAVVTDAATRKLTAVSLDKNPREDNGLKFPHKLHLDPRGGVARMAGNIGAERGYGAGGMQCSDCHRPSEDGVRFKPIEMERDCEACHSLAYDKVGTIFRRLRHGDVDQLIADLSASNASGAVLDSGRKRPGNYARGGLYNFRFSAPAWQGLQLRTAMSPEGVCGECHTGRMQNDGKPGVVPVTLVSRYMHHGWFDHDAHKQEECTSCHAAEASGTSSDVLLPAIKDCRTCHLGEDAAKAEVPSGCAMCHGYHTTAQGSFGAASKKLTVVKAGVWAH